MTASGWEFADNNKEKAVGIVLKYVKNEREYVRRTMERTVEFATSMYGRSVPAGGSILNLV